MPVYVCEQFDVCATAPFDARRVRRQDMRFDVCSKPCAKDPKKESSIGESVMIVYPQPLLYYRLAISPLFQYPSTTRS
jgi:hypothetical protein